jgi:hypothetical protein
MMDILLSSPTTPEYKHNICNYVAELLLLKKYPQMITVANFWKQDKYLSEFLQFSTVSRELCKTIPAHYLIQVIVKSDITDFNPVAIHKFIIKNMDKWGDDQNKCIKRWCIKALTDKQKYVSEKRNNICPKKLKTLKRTRKFLW